MDTMKLTKIVGGVCGALLVYLLINWGADMMYSMDSGHGEDHVSGYVIEVETAEVAPEVSEAPSFDDLLASADVEKGKKVFSKCKACHKTEDGVNGAGPYLFGIFDREIGKAAGFKYSAGMSDIGGNWDAANLNEFLTKPKTMISDTKMSFAGLKKEVDRVNLIAYLQTIK
ncbi:MAG: cytochrome c family protein [Proteobacteria bacterium]|nr:cytochrome c family protein [Pseudomonadota bacterium]